MSGIMHHERSDPKIHEEKSGRPVRFYGTHETYAMQYKFTNSSWFFNTLTRLGYAKMSQYFDPADILRRIQLGSKYDEKHDRRLQLFSENVNICHYTAQLNNSAFYDFPNPKFAEMELEVLWEKLYNGAKFHGKPRRGKHSAMASIYGLLVSLVIVGTVCASYLYTSSLPLPDLEQYHVLVPVVLSFPFLLISSSLRAISSKALATLRQKLT